MEEDPLPSWSFTQRFKRHVHGVAPQHLLDTITRHKIYQSVYWQQYCFGLSLDSFIDRAQLLKGVGGLYGLMKRPCNFLCLFLKLLELEPSDVVIDAMLNTKPWQMKHLRLLAALYVRFTYHPDRVREILEPMISEHFLVAQLGDNGYQVRHFDEIVYDFLTLPIWCGVTPPTLPPRLPGQSRATPLAGLRDELRAFVFEENGLNKDGVLVVTEKKGHLRLKGKKLLKKNDTPRTKEDEIASENALRAALGLKPLRT